MSENSKKMGVWAATALVAGNMIGSGIYLLPSALAKLGGIGVFGWFVSAAGALMLAFVFADLSKMVPKVGGPYAYTKDGFGDYMGFQVAWCYWISVWVGNAAIVAGVMGYLGHLFPVLISTPLISFCTGVFIIWFFTLVNIYGVKEAGFVQMVFTVLKLIPLLLVGLGGIVYFNMDHFEPFNTSGGSNVFALSSASLLTMWAFIGVECASVPADNVENPKKTIPRATIIGTLLVVAVYFLSAIGVISLIPVDKLAGSVAPFTDATKVLFGEEYGDFAGKFIAAGAVISALGALNGWILMQGQVAYAPALDKLFPAIFGKLTKSGVPMWSIVVGSLLITILFSMNFSKDLVDQFEFMIKLATLTALLMYLYCTIARIVISLKKGIPLTKKPIIIASLAFAYVSWAIVGSGYELVALGSLLFFLSTPIYAWLLYKQKKTNV